MRLDRFDNEILGMIVIVVKAFMELVHEDLRGVWETLRLFDRRLHNLSAPQHISMTEVVTKMHDDIAFVFNTFMGSII